MDQNIINSDGWLIDSETGEIIGAKGMLPSDKDIETEKDLWIIQQRILDIDASLIAEKEQLKRITELCNKRINNLVAKRQWLELRYLPSAAKVAKDNLLKGRKTYTSPYGEIAFRTTKDRLVIDDQSKVIAWAKRYAPESVKVEETVLVSKIPDKIKNSFLSLESFMPNGMHIEPSKETVVFTGFKKKEDGEDNV